VRPVLILPASAELYVGLCELWKDQYKIPFIRESVWFVPAVFTLTATMLIVLCLISDLFDIVYQSQG